MNTIFNPKRSIVTFCLIGPRIGFKVFLLCLFFFHVSDAQSGLNVNRGTSVFEQGYLTVGDEVGIHIAVSPLDIQAKSSPFTYRTLNLNHWGGSIYMGVGQTGRVLFYDGEHGWFGVGTPFPETKLHIEGNTDASLSSHGLLVLGSTAGTNIVMDNNEIQARNNGNASDLYLNHAGGTLFAKGLLDIGDKSTMKYNTITGEIGYDNSSRRYKISIETLHDDWSKILKVRPVRFARPRSPNYTEYGYIAEEIDSIGLITLVGYNTKGLPDDVRYDRMVLYLIEILKIQQDDADNQQRKMEVLQKEMDVLKKEIENIQKEMMPAFTLKKS